MLIHLMLINLANVVYFLSPGNFFPPSAFTVLSLLPFFPPRDGMDTFDPPYRGIAFL